MKFIIGKGAVKREIEAPFGICGSHGDLTRLISILRSELESRSFSYGWVEINDRDLGPSNTPPRKWED